MKTLLGQSYEWPYPVEKQLGFVTKLISEYSPLFDEDGRILKRKAAELGISEEELLERWKQKGDESAQNGERRHAETYSLIEIDGWEFAHSLFDVSKYECLVECFVSNGILSAYADCIFKSDSEPKTLHVVDLKFSSKYDVYKHYGKYLLKPFDAFKNNLVDKGLLQLSLIENILSDFGYETFGYLYVETPYFKKMERTTEFHKLQAKKAIETLLQ